ncbi:uncharacterized protein LOC115089569 [Rhinatrema bivittatum]|uniref:uncharacterized protein LOC115089569 n=1 Tax=Rhinatrema bivittatum TaxID=194408 RepID=UPI00112C93F0|nr:uncharacterized protein LOC115089569 [Rhinatrema bivittatum]
MPHTKRKGKVRQDASTPAKPSLVQTTITDIYSHTEKKPPEFPITVEDIGHISPLSGEVSLSPGEPITPAPPMGLATISGLGSPIIRMASSGLNPFEEAEDRVVRPKETGKFFSPSQLVEQKRDNPESQRKETGGNIPTTSPGHVAGQDSLSHLEGLSMFGANAGSPKNVSMEMLWSAILLLQKNIVSLNINIKDMQTTLLSINPLVTNNEVSLVKVKEELNSVREVQLSIIKGENTLLRKVENLENIARYNNLRFVNFPKCKMISLREQLKNYFREILALTPESFPLITNLYFLKERNQGLNIDVPQQDDTLNVTELLETSCTAQIERRGTLLVKFSQSSDKEKILKMFMQNRTSSYLGQKIWVFPDVAKETQARRKKFITLANIARTFGIRIYIRFPSKCIMYINDQKYIYYDPNDLERFLEQHRNQGRGEGTPENSSIGMQ